MALTRLHMPTLGKYNRILFLLYFALYYCECLIKKNITLKIGNTSTWVFSFSFHDVNGPYYQCCYTRVKLGQMHYLVFKTRTCHNYQKWSYISSCLSLILPKLYHSILYSCWCFTPLRFLSINSKVITPSHMDQSLRSIPSNK